ncbi:restriction endonuclease subunit S [Gordonia hankookensis]|uniref:Restriction endonuclease subunit S n=1 Tax=Gordonia hankookensis TaxID=589403 RepID=A0ABR7W6U0_9ACTN|nr:restriction endonuclease subunit S [Gordonia hankookensis]MBD1318533.1 restriction endonuclease subunit S [Gordonia hankookensis]
MTTLAQLFDIGYGNKLDMNKMVAATRADGVAFVGRIGGLNGKSGVAGFVKRIPGVEPYPAGSLTVALGGSRLLSAYVQQMPFYTAQNVAVLRPKNSMMTLKERLYYAMCIRANAFRYSAFGREANRTLGTLVVPDEIPRWVGQASMPSLSLDEVADMGLVTGAYIGSYDGLVPVSELFEIDGGHALTLSKLTPVAAPDGVNFVSRKAKDNGIAGRVAVPQGVTPAKAGTLSVALGATPLATFLHNEPYVTAFHVAVLTPKLAMSTGELLWWKLAIEANKYRYSYGRQANRTLAALLVPAAPPPFVAEVLTKRASSARS